MSNANKFIVRRFRRDERGTMAIVVALSAVVLTGLTGFAIDVGNVYHCQRDLQSATDAAAIAGATVINVGAGGTAVSMATHFSSSGTGALNPVPHVTTQMVTGYPMLKCLTSTGVSCSGPDSANAIEVQQTATVPTFFASLVGLASWHISATSLAGAKGGTPQQLDIEMILDTTQSMNDIDPSCSIANATRETCALAGVRTLLQDLSPCYATLTTCGIVTHSNVTNPMDRVGMMVFPGLTSTTQVPDEYDCSNTPAPTIAKYSASPVYQIIPLSSDYRISDTAPSLSGSSDLVLAARGVSTCNEGVEAVGGVGTFYADAITQAQTYLENNGRLTAQKIIILLSDGAANAIATNMPANEASNQCQEAITAAQNAAAAGTWVYSISYGSSTATHPSLCTTDSPVISSCSTMQKIASDSTKYFSDTSGGDAACTSTANPIQDLNKIFGTLAVSATTARLLPLNTT